MSNSIEERVEVLIGTLPGENRFDKLVDVRDAAQALIRAERAKEEAATKAEVERLSAELSSKRARMGNLEKMVKAAEPRKPRTRKAATK